jgi:hypothetical protein
MNGHTLEHDRLCAGLALGILEEREQPQLAAHRADGCPACDAALERQRRAVLALADALPTRMPPPSLRARVLADAKVHLEARAMEADAAHRPLQVKLEPTLSWKGWAFLYLATVLGVTTLVCALQVRALRAELQAQRAEAQALLARLGQQYADEAPWGHLALAPGARVAALAPAAAGGASGHALFDPASGRMVVSCGGLAVPAGRLPVLWGGDATGTRRLAVLGADGAGRLSARIERAGGAALRRLAITLEPAGAPAAAPTAPIALAGDLRW